MKRLRIIGLILALAGLTTLTGSGPRLDGGHVALGLALRRLAVSGTFLQAPAHPDDENNALLALHGYGMGLRSIDLQNNRGDGGQNEIGPELFRDMAVLRTSELLAAHRVDGAEQYFTRAIDYGYSFDPAEVIAKWGRKDIVGDYVRLFRVLRPDVVLTMNIQGRGGDRAHEATTVLVREAWQAAGDPSQYPEQLSEGLRPWQPRKLYFSGGAAGTGTLARVDTARYDALLGRTYAEIGFEARANHKCQGMGGLPALPGAGGGRGGAGGGYQLVASTLAGRKEAEETSLFDGIDVRIQALAQYGAPQPEPALVAGLAAIAEAASRARKAFDSGDDAGTAAPVEEGLAAVRQLRAQFPDNYELDFRLRIKERDFEDAVMAAHGLTFDAVADDGLVIAGQTVKVTVVASNRGAADVGVTAVRLAGFDTPGNCAAGPLKKDGFYTCAADVRVPASARATTPYFSDDYWKHPERQAINSFEADVPFGLPFRPTPFRVTLRVKAGPVEVSREVPVHFRYVKDTYVGEKRMELNVVPAFSVRVTPPLAVVPVAAPLAREIFVTVTNGTKGKAPATVALALPAGWTAAPDHAALNFDREDEALSARFLVTPPARVAVGDYPLRAVVTSPAFGTAQFSDGYQEVEYPHIERRQVIKLAESALHVVDVKMAAHISVGYIAGVGDQVPQAIGQLGARLAFIEQNELAWGDLSQYDVIVTGVRAYERRDDLRAYNQRLLDYAARGGTVIVQYNKMEFNREQYGPYPAKVSSNRVCDETVPVRILVPGHALFNIPNRIGPATWANWVQERGLYFLGDKDKQYVDLVAMTDSFPDNPGEKLGALVEAKVGKGRWLYLGLGLWRQLPAGTDGAYQLLANLLSLGGQ